MLLCASHETTTIPKVCRLSHRALWKLFIVLGLGVSVERVEVIMVMIKYLVVSNDNMRN